MSAVYIKWETNCHLNGLLWLLYTWFNRDNHGIIIGIARWESNMASWEFPEVHGGFNGRNIYCIDDGFPIYAFMLVYWRVTDDFRGL